MFFSNKESKVISAGKAEYYSAAIEENKNNSKKPLADF